MTKSLLSFSLEECLSVAKTAGVPQTAFRSPDPFIAMARSSGNSSSRQHQRILTLGTSVELHKLGPERLPIHLQATSLT